MGKHTQKTDRIQAEKEHCKLRLVSQGPGGGVTGSWVRLSCEVLPMLTFATMLLKLYLKAVALTLLLLQWLIIPIRWLVGLSAAVRRDGWRRVLLSAGSGSSSAAASSGGATPSPARTIAVVLAEHDTSRISDEAVAELLQWCAECCHSTAVALFNLVKFVGLGCLLQVLQGKLGHCASL
jgi:hypothetical protein